MEKSGDNNLQRITFSMQKGRNLLKPMMICSPSGYIVDAAGLYCSNGRHNDAAILRHMFKDPNVISSLVRPGDVFVGNIVKQK